MLQLLSPESLCHQEAADLRSPVVQVFEVRTPENDFAWFVVLAIYEHNLAVTFVILDLKNLNLLLKQLL